MIAVDSLPGRIKANTCSQRQVLLNHLFRVEFSRILAIQFGQILTVAKAQFGCAFSEEEIPVPIPNTEVKLFSGDGTALLRVGE